MSYVGHITIECQNPDCSATEDYDLDMRNLDTSAATMAESDGWGWHFPSRGPGTFLCAECLDTAEAAEAS